VTLFIWEHDQGRIMSSTIMCWWSHSAFSIPSQLLCPFCDLCYWSPTIL